MTTSFFGQPELGSHFCDKWFRDEFRTALAAAGIEGRVRFHDLRHTALTNLAATGASPLAVMATAGHRSMQTTKQYVHLAGVVFRQDADALERRLLGVESTRLSGSVGSSAAATPLKNAVSVRPD